MGVLTFLEGLSRHDRCNLRRTRRACHACLSVRGDTYATESHQLRYYRNRDVPSGDDPLDILAVHRRLLRQFPASTLPTDSLQIKLFFEVLSPQCRDIFAPYQCSNLSDTESALDRYSDRTGFKLSSPLPTAPSASSAAPTSSASTVAVDVNQYGSVPTLSEERVPDPLASSTTINSSGLATLGLLLAVDTAY